MLNLLCEFGLSWTWKNLRFVKIQPTKPFIFSSHFKKVYCKHSFKVVFVVYFKLCPRSFRVYALHHVLTHLVTIAVYAHTVDANKPVVVPLHNSNAAYIFFPFSSERI